MAPNPPPPAEPQPSAGQIGLVTLASVGLGATWTVVCSLLAGPAPLIAFGLVFCALSILAGTIGLSQARDQEKRRRNP